MHRANALFTVVLLLATGVTGCLGGDDEPSHTSSTGDGDGGEADEGAEEDAASSLDPLEAPPELHDGMWFAMSLETPRLEMNWTLVVTEITATHYLLEPDDPDAAAYEAMWEWLTIGPHATQDLTETASDGVFAYFDFPLTDGKTWESTWAVGDGTGMRHTATFTEQIRVGSQAFPGYVIQATPDEGAPWQYEYAPDVGYISRLGQLDNGTYLWSVQMTDWGHNWTGTTYTATAEHVISQTQAIDLEPGETQADPAPHASFDVSQGQDRFYLQLASWANAGASQATAIDPNGDRHQVQAVAPGTDGDFQILGEFLTPVPGTWEVVLAGAGADTGAWINAWQTVVEARER